MGRALSCLLAAAAGPGLGGRAGISSARCGRVRDQPQFPAPTRLTDIRPGGRWVVLLLLVAAATAASDGSAALARLPGQDGCFLLARLSYFPLSLRLPFKVRLFVRPAVPGARVPSVRQNKFLAFLHGRLAARFGRGAADGQRAGEGVKVRTPSAGPPPPEYDARLRPLNLQSFLRSGGWLGQALSGPFLENSRCATPATRAGKGAP